MNRRHPGTHADRRQVLKILGGGLAAACGTAAACAPPAGDALPTRVTVASIPVGGRLRVLHGEKPIELRRTTGGEIAARSLWCTHFGCEVSWSADRRQYLCPCHDGVFDSEGRPIAGPPPRPLSDVEVLVQGAEVVIGAGAASGPRGEGGP